jgi:hypothetical protein
MIRRLHVPFTKPEDVIPQELAVAWASASADFLAVVCAALKTAPAQCRCEDNNDATKTS